MTLKRYVLPRSVYIGRSRKYVKTSDDISEPWASSKQIFDTIRISDTAETWASVSYRDENQQIQCGVQDEERKININNAPKELLEQLFARRDLIDAGNLALTVDEWRSTTVEPQEEKKIFKNSPFTAVEELILVFEYFYDDAQRAQQAFERVSDYLSVDAGTININTVSREVLTSLAYSVAAGDSQRNCVPAVIEKIIALKYSKGFFKSTFDLDIVCSSDDERNLFTSLKDRVACVSRTFLIGVTGFAGDSKKTLSIIYSRIGNGKILRWRQN
jgi:hypothetical protein